MLGLKAEGSAFILSGGGQMRLIESKENPLYKKLMALKSAHQAKKLGLVLVEGLRQVADLAASGILPDYLFFQDDEKGRKALVRLTGEAGPYRDLLAEDRLIFLSSPLFNRATAHKTAQGVMALAVPPVTSLDAWLEKLEASRPCRLLILEDIQDPGNVGTLIRTADAFAFDAVLLSRSSASIWNQKTVAASMGSLFHLPVFEIPGPLADSLALLKQAGFTLLGTALEGDSLAEGLDPGRRAGLILGNEGSGLSPGTLALADRVISIPMKGGAESLNVAAAGAILMWEAARNH